MKTKVFRIPVSLGAAKLEVGKKIPMFDVRTTSEISLSNQNLLGTRYIISTFPNINTKVCDVQTRHMVTTFSAFDNTKLINVSTNTPASLKEWCAADGTDALMVSDQDASFAKKLGLKLPLVKAIARAVVLVDELGYVRYIEVTPNLEDEPDYKILNDHLLAL